MNLVRVALPYLIDGMVTTLKLAGICCALAVVWSAILAILSTSPSRLVRLAVATYVDIFRTIPILVALIFLYYGVGDLAVRVGLSAFGIAVIAITAIESAYLCEVYRGSLNAIPQQQWHAASSIGLGWWGTIRLVILPQALPPAIPSSLNMLIGILKDSSLASLVTVPEVTLAATTVVGITFEPLPVYIILALMYVALILPLSIATRYLERTLSRRGLHVKKSRELLVSDDLHAPSGPAL